MRENGIRHVPIDLKDNVKINRGHGVEIVSEGFQGIDGTVGNGLYPIHVTQFGLGKILKGHGMLLLPTFHNLCGTRKNKKVGKGKQGQY